MAEFTRRTETVTRHVVGIPNPTNWTELEKATIAMQHQLESLGVPFSDDAVTVEADEEEIRLVHTARPVIKR